MDCTLKLRIKNNPFIGTYLDGRNIDSQFIFSNYILDRIESLVLGGYSAGIGLVVYNLVGQ
jgi:hypothetical protein